MVLFFYEAKENDLYCNFLKLYLIKKHEKVRKSRDFAKDRCEALGGNFDGVVNWLPYEGLPDAKIKCLPRLF